MENRTDYIGGVVVAGLSALWSWVAFAATMALFSGYRATAAIAGPNTPPEGVAEIRRAVPGYWGTFARTLTMSERQSWVVREGTPGWTVVNQFGGQTVKLLAIVFVLTLLVAVPLVLLSRIDAARPAVAGVGLLGGVSTVVLYTLVLHAANEPGSYLAPEGLDGMVVPAATVALPLGLAMARIASRYSGDDARTTLRNVLFDGWLYVVWLPGALFMVEAGFNVEGVFFLWIQALVQGDFPLFTFVSSLLVAPIVLCAFVRDVALALTRPAGSPSVPSGAVASDGGKTPVLAPLLGALERDRLLQAGVGLVFAVFTVGFVGSQITSRPDSAAQLGAGGDVPVPAYRILDALGAATAIGFVTFAVAAVVGVGLGVLVTRTRVPRRLLRLFDPLMTVPLLVVIPVLTFVWFEFHWPGVIEGRLLYGGLGGLGVATLVARRYERDAMAPTPRSAVFPATGLAASGAAVVLFLATEQGFDSYGIRTLWLFTGQFTLESLFWTHLAFVAVPAVSLLLLGEGLRRAGPTR